MPDRVNYRCTLDELRNFASTLTRDSMFYELTLSVIAEMELRPPTLRQRVKPIRMGETD